MIVVDASIAAKLVLEETDSDAVETWYMNASGEIIAPDLIAVEVAQAVTRRVNAGTATLAQGRAALRAWQDILNGNSIALFRLSPGQVGAAAELGMSIGHPVKDCLYLVLAIEQGGTLVTADPRFQARAADRFPMIELFGA